MTDKLKKTDVDTAMGLAHTLLLLAVSKDGPVGLTGLIMATATAGVALGVPMENLKAVFDKSADQVYANQLAMGPLN